MAKRLSLKQGKELVKLARKSIRYALATGRGLEDVCSDKDFLEKRGVFVTLHTFPKKDLRGCVGFPSPIKALWGAVSNAAIEAAFSDPRFPALKSEELSKIIVEVSILTKPEVILGERKKLFEEIEVGKDGLIVQKGARSGLLLPQVATEQEWDAQTFLEECCVKAGLMESMWQLNATTVFKFQAQVFSETEPEGSVEEKE